MSFDRLERPPAIIHDANQSIKLRLRCNRQRPTPLDIAEPSVLSRRYTTPQSLQPTPQRTSKQASTRPRIPSTYTSVSPSQTASHNPPHLHSAYASTFGPSVLNPNISPGIAFCPSSRIQQVPFVFKHFRVASLRTKTVNTSSRAGAYAASIFNLRKSRIIVRWRGCIGR